MNMKFKCLDDLINNWKTGLSMKVFVIHSIEIWLLYLCLLFKKKIMLYRELKLIFLFVLFVSNNNNK
jgi:hypothetical protein